MRKTTSSRYRLGARLPTGAVNGRNRDVRLTGGKAEQKDQLEGELHRMVCDVALSLYAAQRAIPEDWTTAYARYVKASAG